MSYYNLREKWKLINEEQESKEFAFLLESIFTKRRVKFINKPSYKNRLLKEEDEDLQAPDMRPNADEVKKQWKASKSGQQGGAKPGGGTKPESGQQGETKDEAGQQGGAKPESGQQGETKAEGGQQSGEQSEGGQQDSGQQKDQKTAVVEPVDPQAIEKFQQKNKEIINLIFEKSGNGIPETSPEKMEEFAQFRVSPEGSAYDKEVINTITVLSKTISTSDYDKFLNEAFNTLKSKATEKGGFPKNVNTVKGYLNEINNVLKNIGLMKSVGEKERNAYAIYLAFVFAGGYNFIHAGSTGAVGNVAEAFNNTKNDPSKFFETVFALSKELPQDEFIDQVTEYVNNNFSLDETENATNNFKIYISNVYKLRSLMAKVKKQTKIIQKMMKKE